MGICKTLADELWISGTEQYYNKAFELLNNYYITYRKKYLIQNKDKEGYTTVNATFNNWNLKQHIKGNKTYGIFVNKVSKFLTFDIDLKVKGKEWEQYHKWILYKVIDVLQEEGLGQYLNISFSGSKGYHIDIIFDSPVKTTVLKQFGEYIIKTYELDNIMVDNKVIAEVELRGYNNQGVKLPLGLNQKTNKYMYYLNENLEPVTQKKLLEFDLKVLNAEKFYNLYSKTFDSLEEVKTKDIIIYNKAEKETRLSEKSKIDYDKTELDFVVQNEVLKNKGTRNDIIYLVALWCNTHKLNKDNALKKLYRIIENTPEELYNDKTSITWKYKECDRVIEKVYVNNLVLFDIKKVGLNKDILEFIMQSCKTLKQMNIFLCHIYHCLKWGNDEGVYFLSESTVNRYTGATHKTVEKLNKELIKLGILQVIEKGRYIDLGNGIKKGIATTYKLTIPKEILKKPEFYIKNDKIDFNKVCAKHLDKQTILKYIPSKTYYRNFKK